MQILEELKPSLFTTFFSNTKLHQVSKKYSTKSLKLHQTVTSASHTSIVVKYDRVANNYSELSINQHVQSTQGTIEMKSNARQTLQTDLNLEPYQFTARNLCATNSNLSWKLKNHKFPEMMVKEHKLTSNRIDAC